MSRNLAITSLCAAIGLVLAPSAFAQSSGRTLTTSSANIGNVPFDLLPPGARSLGLAGAFTGVADDATASEANPAGLAILTRPEVSISGRHTDFDVRTFNGDARYADVYDGRNVSPFPLYNKASDSTNAVSFASYVHPFEGGKGAFSVYYQNTGKIKYNQVHTGESTDFFDQFTFEDKADLSADALGISGAWRPNDFLSIGASIRYSRLSFTGRNRNTVNFFFDQEFQDNGSINTAGITDVITSQRFVDDDDSDITYNLGLLLNPGGMFSAGIVFKKGGSYDFKANSSFDVNVQCTPTATQDCSGTGEAFNFQFSEALSRKQRVELPDVINLGFALRPSDTWLVSFDIHHTRFGQLPALPSQSLLFGFLAPNARVDEFIPATPDTPAVRITSVKRLSDSTSYHLGAEHTFILGESMMGMKTLSVRGGVFNEKDLGTYSDDATRNLPGIDTRDTHSTVGIGSTFGDHVQVDIGAEFSKDTDNIVLSGIYRF